jgi:hypothetical protein
MIKKCPLSGAFSERNTGRLASPRVFRLGYGRVDFGRLALASRRRARARPASRIARVERAARRGVESADGRNGDGTSESGSESNGENFPPSETAARVARLPNRRANRGGSRLPAREGERRARTVLLVVNGRDDGNEPRRGESARLSGGFRRVGGGVGIAGRIRLLLGRVERASGRPGDFERILLSSDSFLSETRDPPAPSISFST